MSIISRKQAPVTFPATVRATAALTLKTRQSGANVLFDSTTAFTITLPPVQNGLNFYFFIKQPASATGHVIAVSGSVSMFGKVSPTGAASASTAGKGRINTQATSVVGDALLVWCDGTSWYSEPTGTWAIQP